MDHLEKSLAKLRNIKNKIDKTLLSQEIDLIKENWIREGQKREFVVVCKDGMEAEQIHSLLVQYYDHNRLGKCRANNCDIFACDKPEHCLRYEPGQVVVMDRLDSNDPFLYVICKPKHLYLGRKALVSYMANRGFLVKVKVRNN